MTKQSLADAIKQFTDDTGEPPEALVIHPSALDQIEIPDDLLIVACPIVPKDYVLIGLTGIAYNAVESWADTREY